jgi:SAM-dependent methyltransferase
MRSAAWRWWARVFPYQRIIYQGRQLAWGRDRTQAYRIVFPEPPSGKTILDVGCYSGFYCFMAASEGAKYCAGIDIDAAHIARGQRAKRRCKAETVDLFCADPLTHVFSRSFDIVLCLNVLQHMRTMERVDQLLGRLYEIALLDLVVICPLTKSARCEYTWREGLHYLLLSAEYFQTKFSSDGVSVRLLPPGLYGPDRILVTIAKQVPTR